MLYLRARVGSLVAFGLIVLTLLPTTLIAGNLSHVIAAVGLFLVVVVVDLGVLRYLSGTIPPGTKARIHFPLTADLWTLPEVSVHQTPLEVARIAYLRWRGSLAQEDARAKVLDAIAEDAIVAIVYALDCRFSGVVASSHLLNKPAYRQHLCAEVEKRVPGINWGERHEKISMLGRLVLSVASGVPLEHFPKVKHRIVFRFA